MITKIKKKGRFFAQRDKVIAAGFVFSKDDPRVRKLDRTFFAQQAGAGHAGAVQNIRNAHELRR